MAVMLTGRQAEMLLAPVVITRMAYSLLGAISERSISRPRCFPSLVPRSRTMGKMLSAYHVSKPPDVDELEAGSQCINEELEGILGSFEDGSQQSRYPSLGLSTKAPSHEPSTPLQPRKYVSRKLPSWDSLRARVLVLNGANVAYKMNEKELQELLRQQAADMQIEIDIINSNSEQELIDQLQNTRANAIVCNLGGFEKGYAALHEMICLKEKNTNIIQVSPTEGTFPVAKKYISGFGLESYTLALAATRSSEPKSQ